MFKKIKKIIGAKTNKILSDLENPIEQIDYSIENLKHKENELADSLVKTKTSKKSLSKKIAQKETSIEDLNQKAKKMKKDRFSEREVKLVLERVEIEEKAKQKFEAQIEKQDKIIDELHSKINEVRNLIAEWENKKQAIEAQQDLNDINQSLFGVTDKDSNNTLAEQIQSLKQAEEKIKNGELYTESLQEVNEEILDNEEKTEYDEKIDEKYQKL